MIGPKTRKMLLKCIEKPEDAHYILAEETKKAEEAEKKEAYQRELGGHV